MNDYRVLDLFSGIGGFSLGLERAGMETVAFCEQDGYARRVLRKHWPDVWLYEDVRTLTAKRLRKDGLEPNVICGGFPCQDISAAGKGAGIDGPRSGLWSEMFRLVEEIKPLWVVAENVPALRGRGADRVLADLEGAGYAAWPVVVGAVHVGASHRRERVWIVAHAPGQRHDDVSHRRDAVARDGREALAHTDRGNAEQSRAQCDAERQGAMAAAGRGELQRIPVGRGQALADSPGAGCEARRPDRMGEGQPGAGPLAQLRRWPAEPALGRVADGVPARVDRLRCLGNAVVPLIPELIGRAIVGRDPAAPVAV